MDGVEVGHWTDPDARTGCTVVVLPEATVASGEVRGGAPATRDFALLEPGRLVDHVDAVVLSGGSAFGLAAADGVVDELEAQGRGFPTTAGAVPIVVAMALFDLGVGDASVRPDATAGRSAFQARTAHVETGSVGAGTGATVGKWRGPQAAIPGGLGAAAVVRRRDGIDRPIPFLPFAILGLAYAAAMNLLGLEADLVALPLMLFGLTLVHTGEEYYRALAVSLQGY